MVSAPFARPLALRRAGRAAGARRRRAGFQPVAEGSARGRAGARHRRGDARPRPRQCRAHSAHHRARPAATRDVAHLRRISRSRRHGAAARRCARSGLAKIARSSTRSPRATGSRRASSSRYGASRPISAAIPADIRSSPRSPHSPMTAAGRLSSARELINALQIVDRQHIDPHLDARLVGRAPWGRASSCRRAFSISR